MTKKHFNSLAEQLASVRPTRNVQNVEQLARWDMWWDCMHAAARACQRHNPAFDTKRFIAACRGE